MQKAECRILTSQPVILFRLAFNVLPSVFCLLPSEWSVAATQDHL